MLLPDRPPGDDGRPCESLVTRVLVGILARSLVELLEGAVRLLQLVYGQVHSTTSTVCYHVAVSCTGQYREHERSVCVSPSILHPPPPASSPAPGTKPSLGLWREAKGFISGYQIRMLSVEGG